MPWPSFLHFVIMRAKNRRGKIIKEKMPLFCFCSSMPCYYIFLIMIYFDMQKSFFFHYRLFWMRLMNTLSIKPNCNNWLLHTVQDFLLQLGIKPDTVYRTCVIITRSWFETALVYKPQHFLKKGLFLVHK